MSQDPFVITTRRLVLRPVEHADVPSLHEHWANVDVRRYLWDGAEVPLAQVVEIAGRSEQLFAGQALGLWSIRRAGGAAVIGCAGYWPFHDPPQLELVISLSPAYWKQGFAGEAGAALVAYATGDLGMIEVKASTDAANRASQRLLERLGFERTHQEVAAELNTIFYSFYAIR